MIKAYQDMLRKSFRFTGRTNVKSFWLAALMHFLLTVLIAVAGGFGIHFLSKMRGMSQTVNVLIAVLVALCLLLQWPMVPMYIRRMRDTGKSWPMLIALTLLFPGIGTIAMITSTLAAKRSGKGNEKASAISLVCLLAVMLGQDRGQPCSPVHELH